MLSKMGWESGKGLGAKEDGVTAIIKTVKRKDNLGKKASSLSKSKMKTTVMLILILLPKCSC